jgi:hypothetical protein
MSFLSNEDIQRITGVNIEEEKIKMIKKLQNEYQIEQLPSDVQAQLNVLFSKEVSDYFDKKDIIYDVEFNIGVDGLKAIKVNNINMFLQQASPLVQAGAIDAEVIKLMVSKLAQELDYPDIADKVVNSKPQIDPAIEAYNQQMMQIQMQKEAAKAEKDMALAENAKARAEAVKAKAIKDIYSINTDLVNKQVEVESKKADANLKNAQALEKIKGINNVEE